MHKITQKHLGILLSQMGGSIAIDAPAKNCYMEKKLGPYVMGHFYPLDNITYKKILRTSINESLVVMKLKIVYTFINTVTIITLFLSIVLYIINCY